MSTNNSAVAAEPCNHLKAIYSEDRDRHECACGAIFGTYAYSESVLIPALARLKASNFESGVVISRLERTVAGLEGELEAFKESTRLASAAMHKIIALADECRNLATPHERCTLLGAQIEFEARCWLPTSEPKEAGT